MDNLLNTMNEIVEAIDCSQSFIDGDDGDPHPLAPAEFERLSFILDSVLDKNSEDTLLWFWRGWADQFLECSSDSYEIHPNFEKVEYAYRRALTIDQGNLPAAMLLTRLYTDQATFAVRQRAAAAYGVDVSDLRAARDLLLFDFVLLGDSFVTEAVVIDETKAASRRIAREILASPLSIPTPEDLADARAEAATWLVGCGADIARYVYGAVWIYDDAPVHAFHTSYIGWLRLVEKMLPLIAPEDQAGKLLYELADTWDEYDDPQHPQRGELFGRALEWGIDDPSVYFDCLTKAVQHLADSSNHYYEWIQELVEEGIRWIHKPSHRDFGSYSAQQGDFAEALVPAFRVMGEARTIAAVIRGAQSRQSESDESTRVERPIPPFTPDQLFIALQETISKNHAEMLRATQESEARTRADIAGVDTKVDRLYDLIYESISKFEDATDREVEVARLTEQVGRRYAWAEELVRQFEGALKEAPEPFQRDVIVGEALFDYCQVAGYPDYAFVVVHWGILLETWLGEALLVPFGKWLDSSAYNLSLEANNQWLAKLDGTWEERFGAKFRERDSQKRVPADLLLSAAATNDDHPLTRYLRTLPNTIHVNKWTSRVVYPSMLRSLREGRNDAAHGKKVIDRERAQDFHKRLWKDGLLRDLCAMLIAR